MRLGDTPGSLIDEAAATAMEAARIHLEAAGAELEHIVVLVHASGCPDGEDDSSSVGSGFENSTEFAAQLMGHAVAALKAHGIDAKIAPLHGGPFS